MRSGGEITHADAQSHTISARVHNAVVLTVLVEPTADGASIEAIGTLMPNKIAAGSLDEVMHLWPSYARKVCHGDAFPGRQTSTEGLVGEMAVRQANWRYMAFAATGLSLLWRSLLIHSHLLPSSSPTTSR